MTSRPAWATQATKKEAVLKTKKEKQTIKKTQSRKTQEKSF
jgi:hypothetical protein